MELVLTPMSHNYSVLLDWIVPVGNFHGSSFLNRSYSEKYQVPPGPLLPPVSSYPVRFSAVGIHAIPLRAKGTQTHAVHALFVNSVYLNVCLSPFLLSVGWSAGRCDLKEVSKAAAIN